jgi:3-dehydroquinate dehydratase-1
MTHIGHLDLEKKAAVVAVILENPFETARKAAEMGADLLEIRLDLLEIRDLETAAETIRKIKSGMGLR